MELNDLQNQWQALDARLSRVETKLNVMTTNVVSGNFTSSKAWLQRRFRMDLVAVACGLLLFALLLHRLPQPGWSAADRIVATVLFALFGLLIVFGFVKALILRRSLEYIDTRQMSVRDLCAAVLRFRRLFLAFAMVGLTLGVPIAVLFGYYIGRMTTPYMFYGFLTGVVIGLPLGVRRCMRTIREINALRAAVQTDDDCEYCV